MKTIILTYILLLCGTFSYSQQADYWTIFWNEDEEKFGFKDNCGQPLTGKYPIMNVVITHKDQKDFYQDHFDFLKTDDGYKLISLTIRNSVIEE